jgi:RNA polymerase sigma-70 factor (ECF subfamily)
MEGRVELELVHAARAGDESAERGTDPTSAWVEHAAVIEALARLSNEDRILLGLRFGADLEVPDVAAALGIPLGTAKSRLHRALARLAVAMGDDDEQR